MKKCSNCNWHWSDAPTMCPHCGHNLVPEPARPSGFQFAAAPGSGNLGQEPVVERTSDAVRSGVGGVLPPVLDVCCGPRGMWFNKRDPRAMFTDRRRETIEMSYPSGEYTEVIDPDVVADFTELPFPDYSFSLVVFDPPHIQRSGPDGRMTKRYGFLSGEWREMLRRGFAECFRVLRPEGTLIFKWCDVQFPVKEILALTPEPPLFGHKSGKAMQTHWIAFLKADPLRNPRNAPCRLYDPAAEAMMHWVKQKREVDQYIAAQRQLTGGGGAELGANVIERESESGAGSQNNEIGNNKASD